MSRLKQWLDRLTARGYPSAGNPSSAGSEARNHSATGAPSDISADPESGEAIVEFIAMTVIILIPLAYFIFSIATVQSTVLAAEAAARETGRIMANDPQASAHVSRQVDQIFSDYGVEGDHTLNIDCRPEPCAQADLVDITVQVDVILPLIPDGFQKVLVPQLPVIADYKVPVSKLQLVE